VIARTVLMMATAVCPQVSAGIQPDVALERARLHLEDLKVDSALAGLTRAVNESTNLTRQQLTRAYALLGIVEATRGQNDLARRMFREALWLEGALRIDSLAYLHQAVLPLFDAEKVTWSSILRLSSEPAGAEVHAYGRLLGRTPLERRVPADTLVRIDLSAPGLHRVLEVYVPARSIVAVNVPIPGDTLAWPVVPSDEELHTAFLAASYREWGPATPHPQPIPPPGQQSKTRTGWGATLGMLGGLGIWFSYAGLTRQKDSEAAQIAIGIGLLTAGGLIGGALGHSADRAAWQRSNRRYQDYQTSLTRWQVTTEDERARWVDDRVRRRRSDIQKDVGPELDRIIRHNANVQARNATLPDPTVTIQRTLPSY